MRRVSYKAAHSLLALGERKIVAHLMGYEFRVYDEGKLERLYASGCRYFYITS